MRYLLVEDNAELAEAVVGRLALDGHAVDHAASLAEARHCLAVTDYDLILLDVMLPDGDGRDFLARSRETLAGAGDRADGAQPGLRPGRCARRRRGRLLSPSRSTSPSSRRAAAPCCAAAAARRGTRSPWARRCSTRCRAPCATAARRVALRSREIRLLEVFVRHPHTIAVQGAADGATVRARRRGHRETPSRSTSDGSDAASRGWACASRRCAVWATGWRSSGRGARRPARSGGG